MTAPPDENRWTRRYDAVSAVHRRYLFSLLLLDAVFLVLGEQIPRSNPHSLAPSLGTLSPTVLLLLILALLGSSSASRFARRKSGHKRLEPFDLHPNFLDMIVYHRTKLPWPASLAPPLAYPVVLSASFAEAWWLQTVVWRSARPHGGLFWLASIATCVLTIPTLYRLIPFVRGRFFAAWKPPATQDSSVPASTATR